MERSDPLIAVQSGCVCVCVVYCIINIMVRFFFKSSAFAEAQKKQKMEKGLGRGCPRHAALPGTIGAASAVQCLSVPRDLGLQMGQGSGFIARLLKKCYISEFSVCIWTFHLIRISCKAWQIGGREGGSMFHFLIKIKMQKQPSVKLFGSCCCKQNRDMERILKSWI